MGLFSSIGSVLGGLIGGPGGAAVGAGIGGAGDSLWEGGGSDILGGVLQNNSAKAQSAEQMAFQERMSNTAYQRQMKDMELAGLNPILAAKVGGASTPSGSAAPIENVMAPAGSSARQLTMQQAQVQNTRANTAKTIAETQNVQAQTEALKQQKAFEESLNRIKTQAAEGTEQAGQSVRNAVQQTIKLAPSLYRPISEVVRDITNPNNYSLKNAEEKAKNAIQWLKRKADQGSGFTNNSAKSLSWPSGVLRPPPMKAK